MALDSILLRGSRLFPNRTAVVADSGLRYTYKELDQRVNRLCSAFRKIGLSKGDRIAFLSTNTVEYFTFCFACARFGAIVVPLNFLFSEEEITYVIRNSEPKALVFSESYYETIGKLKDKFRSILSYICIGANRDRAINYDDLLSSQECEFAGEDIDGDATSHINYTSGSTGRPKGVILSHNNYMSMINTFVIEVGLRKDDVMLFAGPQFHVGGVAYEFSPLYVGACTVVAKTPDIQLTLELVEREKVTYLPLIPTVCIRLVLYPDFSKYDLSSLRIVNMGGSSMPVDKFKLALELLPNVDFVHSYGLTESSCWLTFNYMTRRELLQLASEEKLRKRLLSCGHEGVSIEVKIVDKSGNAVGPGSIGEVIARGPNIMKGYWRQEEETAKTLRDGWLYTGDLGMTDTESNLYIMDRKKDMIVSGGENVFAKEVEDVISSHPAVQEVAVVGVPDNMWVEAVKAIVVLKPGKNAAEQEIIEYCKKYIASYKKPKSVEFWQELPKNSIGKITKNVIKQRYWGKSTLQDL
jgi:long-chain acyl-CoA synthetase